jgi:antitoxin ParD1/3/4
MNVKISGDTELFIREEVASGRFESPQEVVQEGLRLLHERETLDQQWRERLNGQIEEGLAQLDRGEGIPGEQAFRDLRDKSQSRRENR